MEKSVLDTICASLDTFFESERKIVLTSYNIPLKSLT